MYQISINKRVRKRARRLLPKHFNQVLARIRALAKDPRPHDARKLKRLPGYRITVGEYRVLYTVDDEAKTVTIYFLFHRGEEYPQDFGP